MFGRGRTAALRATVEPLRPVTYHRAVSRFTSTDVDRLARLARLSLTADEVTLFTRQLGDILAFAEEIQAIDTSSVAEPIPDDAAHLRDDVVTPSLDREAVLRAAPAADVSAGLITVPRVFTE